MGPELGLTHPGKTIVCGDSHTSTHGAFGALAFGIGTSEVEHVLATQCLQQSKAEDDGSSLQRQAQARRYGERHDSRHHRASTAPISVPATSWNIRAKRFASLSMEERMTVCNMSIEAGARAGLIAPDETTFELLARPRIRAARRSFRPRGGTLGKQLRTDEGAVFDKVVEFDVDSLDSASDLGNEPGHGHGHHVQRAGTRKSFRRRTSAKPPRRRLNTWVLSLARR